MEPKRLAVVPSIQDGLSGVEVQSVAEEVDLHFWAAVKGCAVERGDLIKLTCEDTLIDKDRKMTSNTAPLQPSLLKSCRSMRTELNRLAGGIASSSSDQVVEMVKKHAGKLTLMDASAKVEVAIMLQLAGDACLQRFMRILDCACRLLTGRCRLRRQRRHFRSCSRLTRGRWRLGLCRSP